MTYRTDNITAKDGSEIIITFYAHASIGIACAGKQIYLDPVGEKYETDFSSERKADLILLTHHHSDHLDPCSITTLSTQTTTIIGNRKCLDFVDCRLTAPYQTFWYKSIKIETIPAYNVTPSHLKYHPKEDGGLGYLLTIGGTRISIAGDTEDNNDILALRNIDIAFLPVNYPYTMTILQVENVVKTIRPNIFYPYHCGTSNGIITDVSQLADSLKDFTEVRIRNMI